MSHSGAHVIWFMTYRLPAKLLAAFSVYQPLAVCTKGHAKQKKTESEATKSITHLASKSCWLISPRFFKVSLANGGCGDFLEREELKRSLEMLNGLCEVWEMWRDPKSASKSSEMSRDSQLCFLVPLLTVFWKYASVLDSWALKPSYNFPWFPAICSSKQESVLFLQEKACFCSRMHFSRSKTRFSAVSSGG